MSAERGGHWLAGVQTSGKLASLILQLAFLALTARALGTSDFGAFAAGWALVSVAAALGDFALPTRVILSLAQNERRVVEASAVAAVCTTSTLALVGVTTFALLGLQTDARITALVLLPWMLAGRLRVLGQAFRQSDFAVGSIARADLAVRLFPVVGALCALAFADSFTTSVILISVGLTIGELTGAVMLWRRLPVLGTARSGIEMLAANRDLGLTSASGVAHSRVDQVLFGSFRAEAAGGLYAFAYRIVDAALALVVSAAGVMLPVLAEASSDVRATLVRAQTAAAALLGIALSVPLVIAAPAVLTLLGGDGFEDATPTVRLLAIVLVVSIANMPVSQFVIVEGGTSTLLRLSVVTLGINIAANLIMIPRYGATGAAITTLFTETLGFLAVAAVASRYRAGVLPVRDLTALAASVCGASAFIYLFTPSSVAIALVLVIATGLPSLLLRQHVGVLRQSPSELLDERTNA